MSHYCWRCKRVTQSKFSLCVKLGLPTNERMGKVECKKCGVVKWQGRMYKRTGEVEEVLNTMINK